MLRRGERTEAEGAADAVDDAVDGHFADEKSERRQACRDDGEAGFDLRVK